MSGRSPVPAAGGGAGVPPALLRRPRSALTWVTVAVLGVGALVIAALFVAFGGLGPVALVTFLAAHALVTLGRGNRWIAKAVDHRVRVLVAHGRLRRHELRICGLTENDVLAKLRELGVRELGL